MTLKFVDVASHQGNYVVGSNGEDGVIVKATQGTGYINPTLDFVAQQVISKNVPWGIYHYAGGGDAIAEADTFIQVVKDYLTGINPPNLILDWEAYQNNAYGNGSWAEIFLNRVKEKTGLQGGIYGNSDDMAQMPNSVTQSAWLWFAGYPSSNDVGWNPIAFPYSIGKFPVLTGWQFSSTPLDKSLFYLNVEEWKKLGRKNDSNIIDGEDITKMKTIIITDDAKYYDVNYKAGTAFVLTGTDLRHIERPKTLEVLKVLGVPEFKFSQIDLLYLIEDMGLKII